MASRRDFLKTSATALAAMATSQFAFADLKSSARIGIQLFTIPAMVSGDFKGTLQKLSQIGYKEIEFFGPYAFSAKQTQEEWKAIGTRLGIKENAFYGYKVTEVKKVLSDLGLSAPSAHTDFTTLRQNSTEAMENFAMLGVNYVVIPLIRNAEDRKDFKKLADELNTIGENTSKYGLTVVYHNHGYEHAADANGTTLMDTLLTQTNPAKVKFELDIFWMYAAGADPVSYLKKYPGRFKMLHLKNAAEPVRFSGDGSTGDQWTALFPKMADPGAGVFDLEKIIKTAKKSGAEHFFVERDLARDPEKTLNDSYQYLSKLL